MTVLEIPTPDPRTFDETSRPFAEAVSARYAIKRLIGRGGMGIVYLARDRRLDRLVAIKTLPPQLAADGSLRERFLRETRTAGAMSHPNIVPIHGADEIDGHVFFVMGFVDGDSLAAHIRALGRLQPREVVRHLRDVASALSHAHGRGIIHRDIKAENILIERATGNALVTDFGIARLAEAGPLTATGQMLGTVYYISPEQVAGEKIDARSDLYSLGVVGFFALTGRFPFEAELASAVLIAHVNKAAPPLRSINADVPVALASIVDRCLAKDPAHRYNSAADMLAALEAVIPDLDRAPAPLTKPRLISDAEAQVVWQRAAQLQASTGIQPRPLPVPQPRDEAKDRARTSGFRVDDVRDAGREAGISTRYLEHALVERGLLPARAIPSQESHRSVWAGVPLESVAQVEIEGEIAPRHFDRIFAILREGTAQVGTTTASKREIGWHCESVGDRLDVSVIPSDGKTTVRLEQNIRRMAGITMVSSVALLGGVVAPLVGLVSRGIMLLPAPIWLGGRFHLFVSRGHASSIAAWIALGIAVASVPIGRTLVRWLARRSIGQLNALTEAVSGSVRLAVREEIDR